MLRSFTNKHSELHELLEEEVGMTHHKSKKVVLENWELPVCDLKVLSKNILDHLATQ